MNFPPLFFSSEKFSTALFSRNLGIIFNMLNRMTKYGVLFLVRNILVIYCACSMRARTFLFLQHETNHLQINFLLSHGSCKIAIPTSDRIFQYFLNSIFFRMDYWFTWLLWVTRHVFQKSRCGRNSLLSYSPLFCFFSY